MKLLIVFALGLSVLSGSSAECKTLLDELVLEIERIPKDKWIIDNISEQAEYRVGGLVVSLTKCGRLYIDYYPVCQSNKRLRKVYAKLVKQTYTELLMKRVLKALRRKK